ncbi:MAG: OmpA family protein [Deferrisomatales bacterium]
MKRAGILAIGLLLLGGCGVSKQIVAEKDAALDACRAELASCQEAAATLRTEWDGARARAVSCEADLQRVRQDLVASQQAAEALKRREDDLRARLQAELRDKTVEIENLRGKLSVRVLDKILFRSGSAQILPEGQRVLTKLADSLRGSEERIRVEGHTDDVPIGAALKDRFFSNWELSAARASSVVRYFQHAHAVAPERMEAVGISLYRPVAPNDTAEGRQRNRRVEIVLTAAR